MSNDTHNTLVIVIVIAVVKEPEKNEINTLVFEFCERSDAPIATAEHIF